MYPNNNQPFRFFSLFLKFEKVNNFSCVLMVLISDSDASMHLYILKLEDILIRANVCTSHGLQHAIAVKDHAFNAASADVTIKNDPYLVSNMVFSFSYVYIIAFNALASVQLFFTY